MVTKADLYAGNVLCYKSTGLKIKIVSFDHCNENLAWLAYTTIEKEDSKEKIGFLDIANEDWYAEGHKQPELP